MMRECEYFRCWAGSSSDFGTWDTGFIEIPEETPDEELDDAVREACHHVTWADNEPPVIVGFYAWGDDLDDFDSEERHR